MNKVFCIGELLIDFINKDINAGLVKGINFEKKAGGAPANVCASVCKLGGKSYFLGQIGKDAFGKFLLDTLKNANINSIGIFVGPEGGITKDEIESVQEIGSHVVSLGPRILRTETASVVASSIVLYELSDLGGDE